MINRRTYQRADASYSGADTKYSENTSTNDTPIKGCHGAKNPIDHTREETPTRVRSSAVFLRVNVCILAVFFVCILFLITGVFAS